MKEEVMVKKAVTESGDYINSFLETIRKEEVEYEEIKLPIKRLEETKWNKLYILKSAKGFDFAKHFIELKYDENISRNIKIDIRPKIRLAHGMETAIGELEATKVNLNNYCDLFNWDRIYLKILDYKMSKGYSNLRIQKEVLSEIIKNDRYEVYAEPYQMRLETFVDISNLEEILLMVLKGYIERYYSCVFRQTETKQLQLSFVKDEDNLSYDHYTLKIEIPKDEKEREKRKKEIEKIKKLLTEIDNFYQKDIQGIPTVHFDKHLYTPLIVYDKHKEFIKSEPVKLNEGETQFVKKLRDYIKQNQLKDKEIFLLRNLSRRGIGFFGESGFYPDFIMWIKEDKKQSIVFIDPKGIRNLGNFNDEKIQLHKNIKDIEREINKKNLNVKLESIILSVSEYKNIKKNFAEGETTKEEFEKNHILFMEDTQLAEKIFKIV